MTDRRDQDGRSGPGPSQGVPGSTVGEPGAPATSGRRRRWWVRPFALVVGLVVVVYVPVPVLTWWQQRQAAEAIDLVTRDRADALAVLAGERPALEVLGDPVRAWSGVDCHLRPRYSDGDGQSRDVVLWWQVCLARAYEVYELPPITAPSSRLRPWSEGRSAFGRRPAPFRSWTSSRSATAPGTNSGAP